MFLMSKLLHLYEQFKPSNYKIHWEINDSELSFKGHVVILGSIESKSNTVTLHAHHLSLDKALVNGLEAEIETDQENELLTLKTETEISGDIEIEIDFNGDITQNMHGIYPSFYEENGQKKVIIGTQFESHHARQAFPCVDEPAAKATFDVSITTRESAVVLGNTDAASKTQKNGLQTSVFETTPVMSTYLLAFVIGDIVENSAKTARGVKVSMWTKPDIIGQTDFALDVAIKVLDYFEEYFDIEYPLKKYDNVALPSFSAGAMENWGLVTYRESGLIVDEKNTSTAMKQYVANVVAHEATHQWFGNLVTMSWWTDLWLNEGFASWMPYIVLDDIFPDWNIWEHFLGEEVLHAEDLDSMQSTHAVEVAIDDPDDIRSIFDAISYAKGASVIGMLHEFLGADAFRNGIRAYLKEHSYSNTSTSDLWKSLENASSQPVVDFMNNWTSQPGFPVVNVSTKSGLKLEQERFFIHQKARKNYTEDTIWPIPINSSDFKDEFLFEDKSSVLDINLEPGVKLNRNSLSFYLANYDESANKILGHRLQSGELSTLDRAGLLADSFRLSKGGYRDTASSLELLTKLQGEKELSVWEVIASEIGAIRSVMGQETRDSMNAWQISFAKDLSREMGTDIKQNDTHSESLLRPIVFSMLAGGQEKEFINYCQSKLSDIKSTNPSLRGLVLNTIARNGGSKEYKVLREMYINEDNPQEKPKLGQSLCSFKDEQLVNESLAMLKTDDVKLQDIISWLAAFFSNPVANELTWNWIKNNWGWIIKTYGEDMTMITYFPKNCSEWIF